MKLYTATDTGLRRANNQDSCAGRVAAPTLAWAVVCDGMGGEQGGAEAAQIARREMERVLEAGLHLELEERGAERLLQTALVNANRMVYEVGQAQPSLRGMGTTVVAAIVHRQQAYILHAGDSRAYHLSLSGLAQLTKDHSLVQLLQDTGEITHAQAQSHPDRHMITRAVGAEEEITGDFTACALAPGETLLLCTDGLYNMLADEEIHALALQCLAQQTAQPLVDQANRMGGLDNITVALLENA